MEIPDKEGQGRGEDSESAGSWKTGPEDMEEWSLEKWRTSVEPESGDSMESKESEGTGVQEELEGEKEVEKEVERDKEEEMMS